MIEKSETILVIEDEESIRDMICMALDVAGFNALEAVNGKSGYELINSESPDLIILDWMLPKLSGIELLRRLRREEQTKKIPVLMLTAKDQETDLVYGLEAGADDYLVKPFSVRELVARIKSLLRRSYGDKKQALQIKDLILDPVSHRILISGQLVKLGPIEFKLLHHLISYPDRVFSRMQLLDKVWGDKVVIEDRTVDVHILRLRKALQSVAGGDEYSQMIQTVHGVGYRFSF